MKNFTRAGILLMCAVCVFGMTSCGKKKENTESQAESTAEEKSDYTVWGDFLESPDTEHNELKFTLTDHPDGFFMWSKDKLTISKLTTKGAVPVIEGNPVVNAFFTDLNGDGVRELCCTIYTGDSFEESRIEVYDIQNEAFYELADSRNYDYDLLLKDGVLLARKTPFAMHKDRSRGSTGTLILENGALDIVNR